MGSENVSLKIKKIRIVGFKDKQQHEDAYSSSKKRKTLDLGPTWTEDELMCFYKAYHTHGEDWKKISAVVGHKTPDMVKALLYASDFLVSSKTSSYCHEIYYIGSWSSKCFGKLRIYPQVLEQTNRHTDHLGRQRNVEKLLNRKQMKHLTFATPIMQGQFLDFRLPSRKDTEAKLVRNSQSHPVGNRTPRIPVVVPMGRSATDDATSELKNAISSTKRNNDGVSNDCANFSTNEFCLDGRSRIMESTKGVEYQTFLMTKGNGDTEIFQNQQPLKRKGNKPVRLLKANQMFDEYISSDDMLILNVLQCVVSAADKMSKVKINFPSGTPRSETTFSDIDRKDEGISLVDLSKQGSQLMIAALTSPISKSTLSY